MHRRAQVFLEHDPFRRHVEAFCHRDEVGVDLLAMFRVTEISVSSVAFVEFVFPLHHHAQVLIVQDERLGGDLFNVRRRQFLHIHQERPVAVDVDDLLVRAGDLGAERGGIAVTHRAETGAGEKLARKLELVILPGPHLMLAHAGCENRLTPGQFVKQLDDHLRQNHLVRFAAHVVAHVLRLQDFLRQTVAQRRFRFPPGDLPVPGGELFLDRPLPDHLIQAMQRVADVADNRQIGRLVFVDFRRVNINVNNGAGLAELFHLARDAVVEPHAERQQQIRARRDLDRFVTFLFELAADGPVRVSRAVHAEPAERQRMRFRKRPHAHDGGRHRNLRGFGKLPEFLARVAGDDAATAIERRPFGFFDQPDDLIQRHVVGSFLGIVAAQVNGFRKHRLRAMLLHVLGNVHDHRTGPSRLRDVESLLHDARNVIDVCDQIAVFHDRQRQAENVRFLEPAFADHVLRHLAGDGDDGNRIEISVGEAGDEVGRAGAAGGHADAGPSGRPRVTFRRERAALFVPGQDGADFLRPRQRLMQFHARAARISEDGIDPCPLQRGDENFASLHCRANVGPFAGLRGFRFSRRFAHISSCVVAGNRGQTKTHDRCQPWVLVEIALCATSPAGIARYDDDHQHPNLQRS